MDKDTLRERCKEFGIKYPLAKRYIRDCYEMACDEIEDGASETDECEMAYDDIVSFLATHHGYVQG